MDLKQLEAFVRVAELGSFTRAALALQVAQPALSRQIRQLEVELRQNLLQRNGRGAQPTEAGALLLDHARGILNQVALAREELGAARSRLAGRVSIGLPPSLSRLVTVPLTLALQDAMPQARVTLTEGFSVSMVEGLRVGNLDLALLYNPEAAPELDMESVHDDALVLISPQKLAVPGMPSTPKATKTGAARGLPFSTIAEIPLILPSRPNAFRLLLDQALTALNRRAQVVIEVDGLNAILSLVAHGVGHAVLPRYTLNNFDDRAPFAVRAIHSPQLVSRLQLVWSSRRPATATHRKALEIVKAVVSDHLQRVA